MKPAPIASSLAANTGLSGDCDETLELYRGPLGIAELLFCRGMRTKVGQAWRVPHYQFVIPQAGAFVWHTPDSDIVGDANQVLVASEGQSAKFSHPSGAEKSFVFTPSLELLQSITQVSSNRFRYQPAFVAKVRPAHAALQRTIARIGAAALDGHLVELEERLTVAARYILSDTSEPSLVLRSRSAVTVRRAKEFLHANFKSRPSLQDIASAVGCSALYLTDLFKRSQGTPLYAYQLRLRLAEALRLLPSCEDITGLALDLGFSSHSHFTHSFRKHFGTTPSEVRSESRARSDEAACSPKRLGSVRRERTPLCLARGGNGPVDQA